MAYVRIFFLGFVTIFSLAVSSTQGLGAQGRWVDDDGFTPAHYQVPPFGRQNDLCVKDSKAVETVDHALATFDWVKFSHLQVPAV